jgi:5-methylcytosine-specific restriction endonuclease McrA
VNRPPIACARCGRAKPCDCEPVSQQIDREKYSDRNHRPGHLLYGRARWKKDTQPAVLRRDPVCCHCKRHGSTVVDHIIDHRGDERLFYDMKNLQGLCKECHDVKTFGSMAARREGVKPSTDKPGMTSDGRVTDYAPRDTVRQITNTMSFEEYKASLKKEP